MPYHIYIASYLVSHDGSEDYGNIDPCKAFSGTCILTEYWPRFFLAAICLLGQWKTNPMKIHVFGRKNSKAPTTNYDSIGVSSVGVTQDNAVVLCP